MNIKDVIEKIVHSGPQHSIIGRDAFSNAAVTVPFVNVKGVPHLLFEKRAREIVQGGEICFPGGVFEPEKDASTADTAVRETCEELGLEPGQIISHGFLGTIFALRGVVVDCYCVTIEQQSVKECCYDTREVAGIFTVPLDFFISEIPQQYPLRTEVSPCKVEHDGSVTTLFPAKKLGLPTKYHHTWSGKDHRVLLYQTEHGPIWGLTAEIVHEIVQRLTDKKR